MAIKKGPLLLSYATVMPFFRPLVAFIRLTRDHEGCFGDVNPLDGKEHSYMELGGWIGDQGLAMQYMALGVRLKVFALLSPETMLGVSGDLAIQMAGAGLLTIQAKPVPVET